MCVSFRESGRFVGVATVLMLICALLLLPAGAQHFGSKPENVPTGDVVMRLRRDADSGSIDAQYQLGLLYFFGQGVAQDSSIAYKYFKDAAGRGHAQAAGNVGIILEQGGKGSQPDLASAFSFYRQAGERGEAEGYFRAGLLLYDGRVPGYDEHERLADAWQLLVRAREAGHRQAAFYMGVMREYGLHLPQDFTEAGTLYSECCSGAGGAAGDPDCCHHYGLLFAYGRGYPQDHAEAVRIFQLCLRVASASTSWAARVPTGGGGGAGGGGTHGPCALYLGMMHGAGQGVPVDYQAARVFLQQAHDSGDPRAVEQAGTAYTTLDKLMQESEAGTAQVLKDIAEGLQDSGPGEEEL